MRVKIRLSERALKALPGAIAPGVDQLLIYSPHRITGSVLTSVVIENEELVRQAQESLFQDREAIRQHIEAFAQDNRSAYSERYHHGRLAEVLGGKQEYRVRCGRIDILRGREVIEVKKSRYYKHAIGQAICYAEELQGYKASIALIGEPDEYITNLAKRCGIHRVYWCWFDHDHIWRFQNCGNLKGPIG